MVKDIESLNLDEPAEKKTVFLVDTGVWQYIDSKWYSRDVYPARDFSDLDTDGLKKTLRDFRDSQFLFRHEMIFTVPRVVNEITRFYDLLQDKLKNLKAYSRNNNNHRKRLKERYSEEDMEEENRRLFEDIVFESCCIGKKTHRRIIVPEYTEQFQGILNAINHVAEIPGVKVDFRSRYQESDFKKSSDLHADEELAAMSIYLSAMENRRNAIITNDSDIARLLFYGIRELEKRESSSGIRELLIDNPLKAYFITKDDEIKINFDTSRSFMLL